MMRCLVDTHTFFWFVFADSRLSASAHAVLSNSENHLYVSVASIWESAIKVGTGKLTLKPDVVTFFETEARENRIVLLPIRPDHLGPIQRLPMHHRDPFDRLLIAQSIVEKMPVVSADVAFDSYEGITRIW